MIASEIMLPPHAPEIYLDRATLWNAVESCEKHPKAQLAYSFDIAMQNELTLEENMELARKFVQEQFVAKGMIADLAFHSPEKEDGGIPNPHFHVMTTMRPLNPDGTWGQKQRREYLLDEDGNRIRDKNGDYMFNAVHTTDWHEPETLEHWREQWAAAVNTKFEEKGLDVRIDHRSYVRQGLDLIPTVHEGANVRQMEAKGIRTEKGELNRWIKATNRLMQDVRKKIKALFVWMAEVKEELSKPQTPSLADLLIAYYNQRNAGAWSNKARTGNLKQFAEAVNYLTENKLLTLEDLQERLSSVSEEFEALSSSMKKKSARIKELQEMLNAGQGASALFPMAKEAALTMLGILSKTPPFSYMNKSQHRERIEKVFTADNALKYVEFAIKAATNSLQFEEVPNYSDAMMLQRYTAVFGHLAYSLGEYQAAMLDFAEKSDGNEADRTAEGFARMFGSYFPPEFSITEGNAWMSTLNNSVQYVSVIRPGEKVAKLVKRIHYVSFVGMFRSDLFEGLCVGHAPKKCKICGKWFLTTNARHTKYCGGYAPGDKLHRTCRQIGNLKGREQRELADDHPLKQIYEKRLNTINRYVKRGTLDADLAEIMKKLAKDKMLRALSNIAYAKGDYEKEMEQDALLNEAMR